jgi:MFS family permease
VWIAILVWAYDVGGASAAALIAVVQLVPATLLAPLLSQLGDRLRRDRALSLGFAFQAVTFLATAAALTFRWPSLVVYLLATLAAVAVTMTRPVHYATLPDISETPEELTAANALSSSTEGFGTFGGPLLTAGLLALSGPGAVYWAAGAAAIAAALMTHSLPLKHGLVQSERRPVLASALEGIAALKQSEGTGRVTFIFGAQFLVHGALDILTVVLGLELLSLDQSGPGTLASALGIGGLIGAAGTVILVNRSRMAPAVAGGLIAFGAALALISPLGGGLIPALLLLAAAGAGNSFVDVAGRTLLQRITPEDVLARVFGLQESLMMGGLAIGAAAAPALVGWLGGRGSFLIVGILIVLVGVSQWLSLGRLDVRAALPGPGFGLLFEIPMFAALEQPVVERLSRLSVREEVRAGQAVITEGEPGNRFYVIESGTVAISKDGVEVNRLGPGGYFGETALLRDVPRTATVRAVTDVVLYALDREPFLEAVTGSPLSAGEAERVIDLRASNAEPRSGVETNLSAESGD